MKLHRFIVNLDFSRSTFFLDDAEIYFQITHVLKMRSGEKCVLCDGNGNEVLVNIVDIQKNKIQFEVEKQYTSIADPSIKVTLFAAVLKSDHFELLAQKCTEAGVFQIIPIISKRTIKLNLRHDRIQKIVKEAAEQSGRGFVPAVGDTLDLTEALTLTKNYDANFFADFDTGLHLKDAPKNFQSASIFIGPEGGFEASERERALSAGCVPVHLGGPTLRAETAAIVSTYLLTQLF